jgi:hypothetical protein
LLDEIVAMSEPGSVISLDVFAALQAPYGLSPEEVDALITAVEATGRRIEADDSIHLQEELALVLPRARAFVVAHGRRPTVDELAAEAGVSAAVVRRALSFGRLIAR